MAEALGMPNDEICSLCQLLKAKHNAPSKHYFLCSSLTDQNQTTERHPREMGLYREEYERPPLSSEKEAMVENCLV